MTILARREAMIKYTLEVLLRDPNAIIHHFDSHEATVAGEANLNNQSFNLGIRIFTGVFGIAYQVD